MGLTATRRGALRILAAAGLAAALAAPSVRGEAGLAGGEFHFSATVGGGKVLLRWTSTERPAPHDAYVLMKKQAGAAEFSTVGPVPIVPLTDPNAIEAVFPAGSELRSDALRTLVPRVAPDIPTALFSLRSSADPALRTQREMLLNTSYGVAIVEGLAYLDAAVDPGELFTYEIWSVDPVTDPTAPVERLGKLSVKVQDTVLPAPTELEAVTVAGEVGDGKVFLFWNPTQNPGKDRETTATGFGFDIYRVTGTSDPNAAIPDPGVPVDDPNSGAIRINSEPVIPVPTTDPNKPNFFFVDGHAPIDPNQPSLVRGTSYKYWLVPRDLLRRHGAFSAPVQVCVPDQRKPRQVGGVKANAVTGSGVELTWSANASDPNSIGISDPYVDDTASYNVYRTTDHKTLLGAPDPTLRIATSVIGTSFVDGVPALGTNQGKNFWYAVTAVDGSLCNKPGNESHYSAPTRGIYYDVTAPTIGDVDGYCDTVQNPRCLRDCGPSSDPNYLAFIKPWCDCGGASGIWPVTGDQWGYKIRGTDVPSDNRSIRLYRGSKGKDFKPVEETPLDATMLEAKLPETFAARISQKLEYRARAMDRDSNLGPSVAPTGMVGQGMPAFVRGGAPLRPVILGTSYDPAAGALTVRWHAPGAGALAGFVLRRPAAIAGPGSVDYLPRGNFWGESNADPNGFRDPAHCDPDDDQRVDFDGDGIDPFDIIIADDTRDLADLIATSPGLGGLRDPATGYFQHTFTGLALREEVDVFSVDLAGQLSLPATATNLRVDADPDTLAWPDRDLPPTYLLAGVRIDHGGAFDEVNVCWDQDQASLVPGGPTAGNPRWVAVFRALVESTGPRGFQQRSPLVDIAAYSYTSEDPAECSTCMTSLVARLGGATPSEFVCWKDFKVPSVAAYKYVVVGFRGASSADTGPRDDREIQAVFASATCLPDVVSCAP
ncbi:MAG: hypothetical protein ACREAA_19110 [Candidatus Polarisedimenticolia bacterium]